MDCLPCFVPQPTHLSHEAQVFMAWPFTENDVRVCLLLLCTIHPKSYGRGIPYKCVTAQCARRLGGDELDRTRGRISSGPRWHVSVAEGTLLWRDLPDGSRLCELRVRLSSAPVRPGLC